MKRKNIWKGLWAICLVLPLLVACSPVEDEFESPKVPCRITIDLDASDSRLVLLENAGVITSVWGKKRQWDSEDGLTVVNLADNKTYTFMLVEGSGTSRGVFESEETPVDGGEEYMVYYPYNIVDDNSFADFGYYSSCSQYFGRDFTDGWNTSAVSMRHRVAHYSDIRFTNSNYQTEIMVDGRKEKRTTRGANFIKSTIMKVQVSGLTESVTPLSMTLKPYNNDRVIFWDTNDTSDEEDLVEVNLLDYSSDTSFEAYMPLSYRDIIFSEGSWLRLSFVATNGKTYYSDKVFDRETVMTGGKLLILNYKGKWTSEYDPEYDPDNQNSAEWEEIIR